MLAQRGVYPADVTGSMQERGRWPPSCRWVKCRWSRLLLVRGLVWITVLEQGYELAAAVEAATVKRLKRAEVVHFDEKGSGVTVLAAQREQYTHLFVHRKRGGETLRSAASVRKESVRRWRDKYVALSPAAQHAAGDDRRIHGVGLHARELRAGHPRALPLLLVVDNRAGRSPSGGTAMPSLPALI